MRSTEWENLPTSLPPHPSHPHRLTSASIHLSPFPPLSNRTRKKSTRYEKTLQEAEEYVYGSPRVPSPHPFGVPLPPPSSPQASSAISGQLDYISRNIKETDATIKAEMEGKAEYERTLKLLKARRAEIQKRLDTNRAWVNNFKNTAGPLASYESLCKEIDVLYQDAKEKHAKGIQMLVDDFDYHIAYKRWSDTFSSIPYKPA